ALLALPALGCGSTQGDTKKQLDELRAEIARLRSTNAALTDRVDVIEMQQGRAREVRDTVTDRPALRVVKLAPSAPEAATPAPEDDAPRMELRSASGGRVVAVDPPAPAASTQARTKTPPPSPPCGT